MEQRGDQVSFLEPSSGKPVIQVSLHSPEPIHVNHKNVFSMLAAVRSCKPDVPDVRWIFLGTQKMALMP